MRRGRRGGGGRGGGGSGSGTIGGQLLCVVEGGVEALELNVAEARERLTDHLAGGQIARDHHGALEQLDGGLARHVRRLLGRDDDADQRLQVVHHVLLTLVADAEHRVGRLHAQLLARRVALVVSTAAVDPVIGPITFYTFLIQL